MNVKFTFDDNKFANIKIDSFEIKGFDNVIFDGKVIVLGSAVDPELSYESKNAIENKAVAKGKADIIVNSISGNIVLFPDGAALPVENLIASIAPVQDLHGYDHPWPAGGGVNLLPSGGAFDETKNGIRFVSDGKGTYTITGTATADAHYDFSIPEINIPSTVYLHMLNTASTYRIAFVFFNGNTQITAPTPVPVNAVKDISSTLGGKTVNKVRLFVANGYTANMTFSPMLCIDDTVKPFSPYSNICPISGRTGANVYVSPTTEQADATTYSVDWTSEAGTVYGGTVDVVSGALKAKPYIASYNGETLVGPWVSSMDAYTQGGTPTTGAQVVDLGGTETEYTLTPQTVSALVGQNYVWADTGDVFVKYRADTKLYIDNKIAQAISAALNV